MTWNEFRSAHPFCSSIAANDGVEVSSAEVTHIADLCRGTNVKCQVSPQGTQIWLGGLQNDVVEVLDRLNAEPIKN